MFSLWPVDSQVPGDVHGMLQASEEGSMKSVQSKKQLLMICLNYAKNLDAYITFSRDDMVRALTVGMDAVIEAESKTATEGKNA